MAGVKDDSNSYKVLTFLLQSCSDLLFAYLTNRELGVLDRVTTDVNLRKTYLLQAGHFYIKNKVKSLDELEWILVRNIFITKCHLDFDFDGKFIYHKYKIFLLLTLM